MSQMFRGCGLLLAAALCTLAPAAQAAADRKTPCTQAAQDIPPRPADAPTGSAFAGAVDGYSEPLRDEAIRHELLAGNLTGFLRDVQPAVMAVRLAGGQLPR